ncbi:Clavaminate synthase-like protein [Gloeophyllum trabeum ATCC 11539]|uniref:Clavaminate synthase-like protein n=1 Tax=Gloeophyllum trabeum (strain ATCC 11539 / FP-39264 / Madison 617) TaxID=670483 RepID=S7PRX5_GLOTA|nr:Clavaminate synthase-like protein [Gloeophyllum trabeum ATCC 11539]EPQ50556.1 Clavaminate synthase-like protein [Gloeophyllum trabeum ATCC 11539]
MEVLGEHCARLGVKFISGSSGIMKSLIRSPQTNEVIGVLAEDGTQHFADIVILSTGAWSESLLDFEGQLFSGAYDLAHIQLSKEETEKYTSLPVLHAPNKGYCFPPTPDGIFKIASLGYTQTNYTTIDDRVVSIPRDRSLNPTDTLSEEGIAQCRKIAQACLPELGDRPLVYAAMCWDTESFDFNWILGPHPSSPSSLFIATAGSGHSFKNLPVIGKYVCDCLEGKLPEQLREAWRWRPDKASGAPRLTRVDIKDLHGWRHDVLDLAKAKTPEGWAQLVVTAKDAMTTRGFLTVINHGYSTEQTKRMFDIANVPFDEVSQEEKERYVGNIKLNGAYQGYKLPQYWTIAGGVQDRIEMYNINHDVNKRTHPQILRQYLHDIDAFAKHCHYNVIHPVLRLLAVGLELPEETLVATHNFDAPGEGCVRFQKYFPRSQAEEAKTENVWLKGHTDIGSITVLWSQPVCGLQIRSPEGEWQWARYIENGLIINVGDMLEFLSGGFYKATIHRVVQPPPSQQGHARLGLFFFGMPDDNVVLKPLNESPVLQRVGIRKRFEEDQAPTTEAWRKVRTSNYGVSEVKKEGAVDVQILNGIVVAHYN